MCRVSKLPHFNAYDKVSPVQCQLHSTAHNTFRESPVSGDYRAGSEIWVWLRVGSGHMRDGVRNVIAKEKLTTITMA